MANLGRDQLFSSFHCVPKKAGRLAAHCTAKCKDLNQTPQKSDIAPAVVRIVGRAGSIDRDRSVTSERSLPEIL